MTAEGFSNRKKAVVNRRDHESESDPDDRLLIAIRTCTPKTYKRKAVTSLRFIASLRRLDLDLESVIGPGFAQKCFEALLGESS